MDVATLFAPCHEIYRQQGCSPQLAEVFNTLLDGYFDAHERILPWRSKPEPYNVFVSEVMLQQTQVPRVVVKFPEFISQFPDFTALVKAPQDVLLKAWSGLGYNRRALLLKKAAEIIMMQHRGALPDDRGLLQELPGIGPATASSIVAFAFNKPSFFIETNIRSVLLHTFFPEKENVTDKELLPLLSCLLDSNNPRRWYSAMMDLGSELKKVHGNPNQRSAQYIRQSPFKGSDREIRGAILKFLVKNKKPSEAALLSSLAALEKKPERIRRILSDLQTEGFITKSGKKVILAHT